jgi:hypothetical protein
MALGVDLAGSCPQMLAYMRDIVGKNYAFDLSSKTGTLDFLTSPAGGGAKIDLTSVQQGKKYHTVKVHYKLRTKPCEILTDASVGDICDTPSEPAELSTTISITHRVGTIPKKFTNDKMINICQDTQGFINEYVLSDMKAMRQKANEVLLAELDAGSGRNHTFNGTEVAEITNKTLQLLGTDSTTGTKVPLFANYSEIGLDFENNQQLGTPNLIGQGILHQFMTLSKFSCCNADGVAYDSAIATAGSAMWLDQSANKILGANEFLVVAPGVASLLWFNRFRNVNIVSPILSHIVLPDPVYPGLAWDVTFKWDECEEAWLYNLKADFDLFTPPTDQFGSDDLSSPVCEDDLVGTTGIFKYRATSA